MSGGHPNALRSIAAAALAGLTACAQLPGASTAGEPPAPASFPAGPAAPPAEPAAAPPSPGALEPSTRAGEQALLAGLRAYDDGNYKAAEQRLGAALKAGLTAPRDRAAAHKTLAFLYCTSERIKSCEASFRAARTADPRFALNKAESGHPLWGPVYRRALGLR